MIADSTSIRRLVALGAATLLIYWVGLGPAWAERPQTAGAAPTAQSARTMEGILEKHFSAESGDPATRALRDAHFTYNRVLVAEALPGGKAFLVEVALANKHLSLRYPVKLERAGAPAAAQWRVVWTPDPAYARALAAATRPGALADVKAGQAWSDIHRLPAFPIIVGSDYLVTPFGRIEAPKTGMKRRAKAAGLHVSEELTRQVQRWTGQICQDDPGSANVDILLMDGISWKRAIQAVLAPAMEGLFRIYFIGRGARDARAISAVAPVLKQPSAGKTTIVVAVSQTGQKAEPAESSYAVRIRVGAALLGSGSADKNPAKAGDCPPEATFCTDSVEEFSARSGRRIRDALQGHKKPVARVMLAATGEVPAARLVEFLHALGPALALPTGKVFAGYIGQ